MPTKVKLIKEVKTVASRRITEEAAVMELIHTVKVMKQLMIRVLCSKREMGLGT
jgi:hypothetical protein